MSNKSTSLQASMYAQLQAEDRLRRTGSAPSNPNLEHTGSPQLPHGRDGGAEPITAIDDPELRAAFMRAHRAWALRYQPHLLEPWLE